MEQAVQLMLAASAALLATYLVLAGRREKKNKQGPEIQVIELSQVVQEAQIMNSSFFRSLELVQKNLEALLARAFTAEQKLAALLPQAQSNRSDLYAKAALLLAGGKVKEEISQTLGLPLAQVRLIEELRREAGAAERTESSSQPNPTEAGASSTVWRPAGAEAFPTFWATREQYAAAREKVAARFNGAGR
jgi:hypothetical protein